MSIRKYTKVIAVDGSAIADPMTGIGNLSYQILLNVAQQSPDTLFYVFSPYKLPYFNSANIITNFFPEYEKKDHSFGWRIYWFDLILPRIVNKTKADYFWGLNGTIPLFLDRKVKTIIWAHDFVFLRYPKTMNFFPRIYRQINFKWWCHRANLLICISHFTEAELLYFYKKKADGVIYVGIDPCFKYDQNNNTHQKKDFVMLGTLEPRKNFKMLINALMSIVRLKKWPQGEKLLIIGSKGWKEHEFAKDLKLLEDLGIVQRMGYLPTEEVAKIMRNSRGLIMPSIYEGFGMPVAEALSLGCPVFCSDIEPFHEIDVDNVCYFHPLNEAGISKSLISFIENPIKQNIPPSVEFIEKFSWSSNAKKFIKILKENDI